MSPADAGRRPRLVVERGQLDSPAGWALLSLLGHLATVAILLTASLLIRPVVPPPEATFAVSLGALPRGNPVRGQPAAAPPSTLPKPPTRPPEKPKAEPPAAPVPKPRDSTTVPREKPAAVPAAPAAPEPAEPSAAETGGTQGGETGAPAGPAGDPGGEEGIRSIGTDSGPFASYTARLIGRLRAAWRRPVAPDATVHSVTVAFSIRRDGRLADLVIETPSGLPALDLSAERAVEDAAPFPPLPSGFEGDLMPARIVFELTP